MRLAALVPRPVLSLPHRAPPAAGSSSTPPAAVISAPTDGAANVNTATELRLSGTGGSVTLTDAAGVPVDGALRADGSAWVPAAQLKYATSYTATVTSGEASTKVTFTTMAKPGRLVSVSTPLSTGKVYGVGLPIVVRFGSSVAPDGPAAPPPRSGIEVDHFVHRNPRILCAQWSTSMPATGAHHPSRRRLPYSSMFAPRVLVDFEQTRERLA